MKKIILLLLSIVTILSCNQPTLEEITYTDIIIKNSSDSDSVKVYVTLQSTDSVIGMFGITDSSVAKCKGFFFAQKNIEYHINRTTPIFGAVISFIGDNQSCEAAVLNGFKTGVSSFEFTTTTFNECIDVTCEDGINSIIKYTVSDTIHWTTGKAGYVENFRNATNVFPLEDNCGIRGVFPYRCSDCTNLGKNPSPNCFKLKTDCNGKRICQVNRANHIGGSVLVEFLSATK